MAAPAGNKYWQLAESFGREKEFTTPDELWLKAIEYFQWVDDNPFTEQFWVGKDGEEVFKNLPRPYTLSGLCVFLNIDEQTLKNYGTKSGYEAYFGIYTRIVQIVRSQKFEGAAAGLFNASIIARDLGLVDKTDNTNTTTFSGLQLQFLTPVPPPITSEKDVAV